MISYLVLFHKLYLQQHPAIMEEIAAKVMDSEKPKPEAEQKTEPAPADEE